MFNVEIKLLKPIRVIGLPHRGSYLKIGQVFEQLWQILITKDLIKSGMISVAAYYDNPDFISPDQLRSFAGVSALAGVEATAPLTEINLTGGDHAILQFKGTYAGLHTAFDWLFGTWLPASQRKISYHATYEVYLNDPSNTPPAELLTEIRVPLLGLEK